LENGVVVGPFRFTSGQDPKNPARVTALIVERDAAERRGTSIFSLPDRDYYFRSDEKSRQIREAFLQHVGKMLELAGTSQRDAAAQSKMVLDFEAELARSVMPIAENSTRRRLPTSWTWPG
jgi:endothelin-converting enzyme/putative endopeptidase